MLIISTYTHMHTHTHTHTHTCIHMHIHTHMYTFTEPLCLLGVNWFHGHYLWVAMVMAPHVGKSLDRPLKKIRKK